MPIGFCYLTIFFHSHLCSCITLSFFEYLYYFCDSLLFSDNLVEYIHEGKVNFMSKKIITISREFGSGGLYIGQHLADRLGYELYDRDLIFKVVERTLLPANLVVAYNESLEKGSVLSNLYFRDTTLNDTIIDAQKKIIYELAEKKNCIIVGRCANYYLKEWENVLNVFIESDKQARLNRICELHDCDLRQAEKMMADFDKKRHRYYQYCTKHAWGDRMDYDIVLNSSKIGLDTCVDVLETICR